MSELSRNPLTFRKSVTSQWGEDGVIEEIFNRIGTANKFCVEFGAWDGKHLSNTWDLWHNKSWSAILIEGDAERTRVLEAAVGDFGKVTAHNAFVSIEGANSLDNILTKLHAPLDLDLLSIDIDSDDYYIFQSLERFVPRLVVVEYNPTIPPELRIVQSPGEYFGASALALVELAKKKNYRFVGCTDTNCFFVRDKDFPLLEIQEPDLRDVFPREYLTHVVTSQNGSTYLTQQPTYAPAFPKASLTKIYGNPLRAGRSPHPKLVGEDAEKMIAVRVFGA